MPYSIGSKYIKKKKKINEGSNFSWWVWFKTSRVYKKIFKTNGQDLRQADHTKNY